MIKRKTIVHQEGMVLNKFLAHCGLGSRRQCADWVKAGWVKVNGRTVREPSVRVQDGDRVLFKGKPVRIEKKYYVLLNKTKGVITTTRDENDRPTVMDLLNWPHPERLYPVGRLDRNTTGVLLLTNDGDLAQRLLHPSGRVTKVYRATLDQPISREHLEAIAAGVPLEDGVAHVDAVALPDPGDARIVGLELHSGKNRVVRRIFEQLGYQVIKLDRTSFAGLTKRRLPPGHWRYLTSQEVNRLRRMGIKPRPKGE
ncbi:MAG: pseudouridine synthase [Chitinophagales bacterium]|nr:rRNA pseudouridine synthase [Chitinophagales bacterium]MDW8393186.1 pseudouridine synthase [Chitinophagales bacterium]